jgi:RNA polymerase sigma-70 factor, Bacteroides expansion family 1
MKDNYTLSPEELFKRYYPRLCHFAWQFVHDRGQAEDIAQDAFMAYWSNQQAIADDDTAIKNFLYSSVRNACFNLSRHEKVVQRFLGMYQPDTFEESEVMAKIIRSEVLNEIYTIIQSMPAGCKEVFRLGYLEGLTNLEIAERLNISVNTVKTQKQRGLRIVKNRLNPELLALLVTGMLGQ